jgi:hypothetical protein
MERYRSSSDTGSVSDPEVGRTNQRYLWGADMERSSVAAKFHLEAPDRATGCPSLSCARASGPRTGLSPLRSWSFAIRGRIPPTVDAGYAIPAGGQGRADAFVVVAGDGRLEPERGRVSFRWW